MLVLKQPMVGKLVQELPQEMGFIQKKFPAQLRVISAAINRWKKAQTTPSPSAIDKSGAILKKMVERGQNLLSNYCPQQELG